MMSNFTILCFFGVLTVLVSRIVCHQAIIRGDIAQPHQFPYQVALMVEPYGLQCGGGILNSKYILTAAHCVVTGTGEIKDRDIWIYAGSNDFENPAVFSKVKKIYVPSEFNPASHSISDIAVLKLKDPLHYPYLRVLELPDRHDHVGERGIIAGWGWHWVKIVGTHEIGNYTDSMLRFAQTTVIPNHQCKLIYPSLMITKRHICARVQQKNVLKPRGVCIGDSGGPLVHQDGRHVIGILSQSPNGCVEEEKPAIYTHVADYLEFIHHALHDLHADDIKTLELTR